MPNDTPQTKEERFMPGIAGIFEGSIKAYTSVNSLLAAVHDQQTGICIPMYVHEARALRDWLNKVLP